MIGFQITDEKGEPLEQYRNLAKSTYQPSQEVASFLAKVQKDYYMAYSLQNRSFDEFDGYSLLQRTNLDQQLFGAYVGAQFVAKQNRWRWMGRKNTARNKLIGIAAHMIAGMLFPYVKATNQSDEPDKMAGRVMQMLVENHLKKAGYETKFLYMMLSALVNPATFVHVEYLTAIQKVKQRLANGQIKVIEAVDELLTGVNLNIIQVDELLLPDFYSGTGNLQALPNLIRVRRISYDQARAIYSNKYFNEEGKDLFDYVMPGTTRVVISGQDGQTLYDIDWSEADRNYVQVLTYYYKSEDLEVDIVGGIFMGNENDLYNSNPFKHRRMSLNGSEWITVPVYPYVMSGFEPLDPGMRFAYFKSGAFKEYWDDLGSNTMDRLLMDGTYLDVFKPQFLSGVAKSDNTVMAPGATVFMPNGAKAEMYNLGPNLAAAINALREREKNMSESTQDPVMGGEVPKNTTAYAVSRAEQNARIFLGIFGLTTADLVRQIGELVMDLEIMHATVGEMDATVPEALRMKYKTRLVDTKDRGKNITNKIEFTDMFMGRSLSKEEQAELEYTLFTKNGGDESDQRTYLVDPYKFARTKYAFSVDADKIIMRSTGTDQQKQILAFQMMTSPQAAPFIDQKNVVEDFVIEPFANGNPERYQKKEEDMQQDMLNSILSQGAGKAPMMNGGATQQTLSPALPAAF